MNTRICDIHRLEYPTYLVMGFYKPTEEGFCYQCEIANETERVTRELEEERLARIESMKRMNIEPMYYESTLDTFEVTNNEQERAKNAVSTLIKNKAGKIVMLGKHGTGKTHLAISAVRELGGKILSMYEISTRIRATYSPRANEDEMQVTDGLAYLPMLAIDEIGRTKGSEAETNWLSYIIDKRHVRGLPLILISNKHARKQCEKKDGCPECLENYISEDIMSRLREDGVMITFTGDDHRVVRRGQDHTPKTPSQEEILEIATKRVDEKVKELEERAEEFQGIMDEPIQNKSYDIPMFDFKSYMSKFRLGHKV